MQPTRILEAQPTVLTYVLGHGGNFLRGTDTGMRRFTFAITSSCTGLNAVGLDLECPQVQFRICNTCWGYDCFLIVYAQSFETPQRSSSIRIVCGMEYCKTIGPPLDPNPIEGCNGTNK